MDQARQGEEGKQDYSDRAERPSQLCHWTRTTAEVRYYQIQARDNIQKNRGRLSTSFLGTFKKAEPRWLRLQGEDREVHYRTAVVFGTRHRIFAAFARHPAGSARNALILFTISFVGFIASLGSLMTPPFTFLSSDPSTCRPTPRCP